jgi:hypothetical protein
VVFVEPSSTIKSSSHPIPQAEGIYGNNSRVL